MRDRFGARDDRSCMLRFHTQTGGSTLTAQQIENNIVRVAIQALAAVLGGTQSLHTNSKDEALGLPTDASARTALRTQQVIAHESGVADFIDPFAGSHAVEWLTDELEKKAVGYIEQIDRLGGMVVAIEQGYVQREIQDAAYRYQLQVERGEQIVVGVNKYQSAEAEPVEVLKIDPALERAQIERVRAYRARRQPGVLERHRAALVEGAKGDANLVGLIHDAVGAGLTVGEICGSLETVFGRYREPLFL
jgi:methylmalonyl-CoA mutase N-terminal domain/subunit